MYIPQKRNFEQHRILVTVIRGIQDDSLAVAGSDTGLLPDKVIAGLSKSVTNQTVTQDCLFIFEGQILEHYIDDDHVYTECEAVTVSAWQEARELRVALNQI